MDEGKIRCLIFNLVCNVCEVMMDGGCVVLGFDYDFICEEIVIMFIDNGLGIFVLI